MSLLRPGRKVPFMCWKITALVGVLAALLVLATSSLNLPAL